MDVGRTSRVQRHHAIHVASDYCYGNKKATESARVCVSIYDVGLSNYQTGYNMIGFWIMAASPHRMERKRYSRLSHWYIETTRVSIPYRIRINRKFYLIKKARYVNTVHAF